MNDWEKYESEEAKNLLTAWDESSKYIFNPHFQSFLAGWKMAKLIEKTNQSSKLTSDFGQNIENIKGQIK